MPRMANGGHFKFLLLVLVAQAPGAWGKDRDTRVVGWVEKVALSFTDTSGKKRVLPLEAKVDTGAKTSSLHALGVRSVLKDGKEFARFTVSLRGEVFEVEERVRKETQVRSSDGESEERQFIAIDLCIGNTTHRVLVTLNNREKMQYPLLLGRRFLEKQFWVDPANKFLLGQPVCW